MQRMEGEREMLEKEDRTLSEVKTGKLKGNGGGVHSYHHGGSEGSNQRAGEADTERRPIQVSHLHEKHVVEVIDHQQRSQVITSVFVGEFWSVSSQQFVHWLSELYAFLCRKPAIQSGTEIKSLGAWPGPRPLANEVGERQPKSLPLGLYCLYRGLVIGGYGSGIKRLLPQPLRRVAGSVAPHAALLSGSVAVGCVVPWLVV
ncbi:hypothetical protein E3U43_002881 [Larimichthys crocea]|uniref:Uncharacterized protein n=1 Tax=Larimichthys crocea TaxID=215358 RepID=A0ACD3QSD2_LARCR|nr:hypothetical protein E3U43_002881 [Larimichthys crocea]